MLLGNPKSTSKKHLEVENQKHFRPYHILISQDHCLWLANPGELQDLTVKAFCRPSSKCWIGSLQWHVHFLQLCKVQSEDKLHHTSQSGLRFVLRIFGYQHSLCGRLGEWIMLGALGYHNLSNHPGCSLRAICTEARLKGWKQPNLLLFKPVVVLYALKFSPTPFAERWSFSYSTGSCMSHSEWSPALIKTYLILASLLGPLQVTALADADNTNPDQLQ